MCSFALLLSSKLSLIISIWGCFLWWAFNWYFSPSIWNNFDSKVKNHVDSDHFDGLEHYLVYWGGPPMAIALLSTIYFALPKEIHFSHLHISRMYYSISNITIVLPKPFGIATFAEIFGMLAIIILVALHIEKHTEHILDEYLLHDSKNPMKELLSKTKVRHFGNVMGSTSALTFCLLFIPVSRRSPIMRILGIPYELALRYHVWLGHITCFFSTSHAILYSIAWAVDEQYWIQLRGHRFSGLILVIVSLIMWGASLSSIRRKYFEVFYYTHHLYPIYLLLYTFHVGGWILLYAFAALFLFFLDRLLRFFQSRHPVNVLSARLLQSGYIQIDLPITQDLATDSLGICFLNVPTISSLQWHPFSISSRSFETPGHVSVLIKPSTNVNAWTFRLSRSVCEGTVSNVYFEGPYNSEFTYFNRYDSLILVAGGAGITPFRSILQEVSHLHSKKLRAPSFVQLIWIVREAKELELLSTIRMETSNVTKDSNLTVCLRLFVTKPESQEEIPQQYTEPEVESKEENGIIQPIVPPIGSQNGWLTFFITCFTCVGTLFVMALFCRFLLVPTSGTFSQNAPIPYFRLQGLVFYVAFLVGIVSFGALTSFIALTLFDKRKVLKVKDLSESLKRNQNFNTDDNILKHAKISYGMRPNWNDEFVSTCKNIGSDSNVGVFACGPEPMVRSVVWECQKRSLLTMHSPRLNFHSLSFEF